MGLYRSAELKKRERLLSEIIHLLEQMAVQVRYRSLPLGELFVHFENNIYIGRVLEKAKEQNWRDAWNTAAKCFSELHSEDIKILINIGNALGGSDTAGQVAMLELNKNLLTARLKEASESTAKKGAMYRSVGFFSGLGLAIIVI